MFAAPPSVEAQVFATIPEKFHKPGGNEWTRVQLRSPASPVFLEGPAFDREGNLWLVDIPWGRLFKVTPQGDVTCELEYDGYPNGLAFHRDGRLFIADAKHGIMVLDPASGKLDPVLSTMLLQPFRGVNDLTFASNGDLYFTDQGHSGKQDPTGRVYRLKADGRLECLINNVPSPNGLILNKAENVLYLAVTRDNAVWRMPLLDDGAGAYVSKVGAFIRLSGGVGPDGLALGEDDSVVICHTGLGSVWLFSPLGEPMLRIKAPHGTHTTNCAFGGPNNDRIFVTEGPNILCADLPVRGHRLFSHA